jgi:hypothetical protein
MRVTLRMDSVSDAEMKRALLAWHYTTPLYTKPALTLDGLVVKVEGSGWNIESPPISAARAEQIIEATKSDDHLGWLRLYRDETLINTNSKESV